MERGILQRTLPSGDRRFGASPTYCPVPVVPAGAAGRDQKSAEKLNRKVAGGGAVEPCAGLRALRRVVGTDDGSGSVAGLVKLRFPYSPAAGLRTVHVEDRSAAVFGAPRSPMAELAAGGAAVWPEHARWRNEQGRL